MGGIIIWGMHLTPVVAGCSVGRYGGVPENDAGVSRFVHY